MLRLPGRIGRTCVTLLLLILLAATLSLAQFETATVSGQVSDPTRLSVVGARVDLIDIDCGTGISATTNNSGLYRFASVHPGRYRMEVRAVGFWDDRFEQNFKLTVGSVSESVTVEGKWRDTLEHILSLTLMRDLALMVVIFTQLKKSLRGIKVRIAIGDCRVGRVKGVVLIWW
jgi:hypothetical protein